MLTSFSTVINYAYAVKLTDRYKERVEIATTGAQHQRVTSFAMSLVSICQIVLFI